MEREEGGRVQRVLCSLCVTIKARHVVSIWLVSLSKNIMLICTSVVSSGHSRASYVVFVPLDYILNIPPHYNYVIVFSAVEQVSP